MKAVYLEKPWDVSIKEIAQRPLEAGEALIQIKSAGICGSDIGAYRGTNGLVTYPRVIGQELAGVVLSLPEDAPEGIRVGDRVVLDPYLYCGNCYPCSIGRTNCCNELRVLGVHVDGGMTETIAHPAHMLVKIPDNVPWELAPLAEPLTIALHGIHRLGLKAGEFVVIFGAGGIGLLAALVALHYGGRPILVDPVQERLDFAKALGVVCIVNPVREELVERVAAYTGGRFAECVMEASGSGKAIRDCLDVVCHAGRVAFTGWPKGETSLPTDIFTRKELDVRGARNSAGEFAEAIELIASGKVDAGRILTKVISVEEVPEMIRQIEQHPQDYLKVNVLF